METTIMEKKMEITIMENQMETTIMEKKMETTIVYRDYKQISAFTSTQLGSQIPRRC